jgi:hypothetical protein
MMMMMVVVMVVVVGFEAAAILRLLGGTRVENWKKVLQHETQEFMTGWSGA